MFDAAVKVAFVVVFVGCLVPACSHFKEAGRTIGHTTRDVARDIGHGTRDVAREIGHGTRDAAKAVGEGVKKVVKPEIESEY